MHTNQTSNSLIIEDVSNVPFPKEIKEFSEKLDWESIVWQSLGLPAFDSNFCVSGNILYLVKGEQEGGGIKQIDFTGETMFKTFAVNPNKDKDNFSVTFKGLFYKGVLSEVSLDKCERMARNEYEEGLLAFQKEEDRLNKIRSSKWYKYLYVPYLYVLRAIGYVVVYPIEFCLRKFCDLLNFMSPIKLD